MGRAARGLSLPRALATRAGGHRASGNVSPERSYPSACLTWLESKNKKNYDAGEACEGEKRFHFSPTTASWRDSRGPSPALLQLPPRAPGGRAQRHRSLPPRWLLLSSVRRRVSACRGREGGHYRLQSKRPVLKAKPWGLQWVVLNAPADL